jgi:hypothetical protein
LTVAVGFFPDSVGGTLTAAGQGDYDVHYIYVAQQLVDHGHADAIIRPAWEFNSDSYPWGYNAPGQDQANYATNYIAAFRDMVTAFKAISPNFTFVWNPNLEDGYHYPDYQLAYPGDDVVDMVGVDVYDLPRSSICDPAERWARDQAGPLDDITSFAMLRNKPVSLPEWAAGEVGDNPYFVNAVADWLVGKNVGYIAYWNGDAASGYNGDLDIYPQQKEAFITRFGGMATQPVDMSFGFGDITGDPFIAGTATTPSDSFMTASQSAWAASAAPGTHVRTSAPEQR